MAITDSDLRTVLNELIIARETFSWALKELDRLRADSDWRARFRHDAAPSTLEDVVEVVSRVIRHADPNAKELANRWLEQCQGQYGNEVSLIEQPGRGPDEVKAARTVSGALYIAHGAAECMVKRFAVGSNDDAGAREVLRAWRRNVLERGLAVTFRTALDFLEHATDHVVSNTVLSEYLVERARTQLGYVHALARPLPVSLTQADFATLEKSLLRLSGPPETEGVTNAPPVPSDQSPSGDDGTKRSDDADEATPPNEPLTTDNTGDGERPRESNEELGQLIYEMRLEDPQPSMKVVARRIASLGLADWHEKTLTRKLMEWCEANRKTVPAKATNRGRKPRQRRSS